MDEALMPSRRAVLGGFAAAPLVATGATVAAQTRQPSKPPSGFIIDAVAHAYNFDLNNYYNRASPIAGAYNYHLICNPPEHRLTVEQWAHDWQPEEFIDTMLLESTTDLVCMHSVILTDFTRDGLVTNAKGAYLKKHYPDRVIWYAGLDLSQSREQVIALANDVVAQGADGIKLYPRGLNQTTKKVTGWHMDDQKVAFPIIDHLRDLGVKHVAVHKLLEYDDEPLREKSYYGINDIAGAAKRYPDLTFHLVHAGWALVENTVLLMREYPNVTAVLEGPMLWAIIDPPRFDSFLYTLMTNVGVDRLMYSSAATGPHPRWVIEAFERHTPFSGTDPSFTLTQADRDAIMGGNFARLHGIDIPGRRIAIADDRFSRYRAEHGLRRPWTASRGPA